MTTLPTAPATPADTPARLAASLSLETATALRGGSDAWHFPGIPELGFPPVQVADCGHGVTLVAPPYGSATCFPTSVGMAATWDTALLEEVGAALARESLAKNLGMLLAPMVNLHRLPCGGRNYETFSEDPVLTGRLAAALIRGLQSAGVSACIKSFACNNQQKDQKYVSSDVDPRTLRELYLKVFAIAFAESRPWAVMTSYNAINGEHPSDSAHWLETILRGEMGYDGLVVSDWNAVQGDRALASGLDIEMPGPPRVLSPEKLSAALAQGVVSETSLRTHAARLIGLYRRIHALDPEGRGRAAELDSPRHRALARRVAEQGIVLLRNQDDTLPLDASKIHRIAVVGPNAAAARLGGGGSASVLPPYTVSPLAGITTLAAKAGITVTHAEGCPLDDSAPVVPSSAFAPPDTDHFGQGLRAEFFTVEAFDRRESPLASRQDDIIDFSWGWAAPIEKIPRHLYAIRWSGRLRFPASGTVRLSVSTHQGLARVWLDGRLVLDAWSQYDESQFEDKFTNRHASFNLETRAGDTADLVCEYRKTGARAAVRLSWELPGREDSITEAVRLAAEADVAVVCTGLSNIFEGGNCDRLEHGLPGRQVELIRRVAAANPRTIVVLSNGTPVATSPWRDQVAAIVETFYPGQEGGNALARILFGEVNPSGRLPDTFPRSWDQVEAMRFYPGADGHAPYDEGLFVGYRDADAHGWEPEFPFGFGLSYTTFEHSDPRLSADSIASGNSIEISVDVTNTGAREGSEVVQAYLEPVAPAIPRPPRELFAFVKVRLAPGERRTVTLELRHRDLLTYNPESARWMVESPFFRVVTGPHSRALRSSGEITAA